MVVFNYKYIGIKVLKGKFDIDVIIPDENEREIVHEIIYKKIINNLAKKGAEGVILGCTEIPLLIKQEDVNIAVFDTTTIHAIFVVDFALGNEAVST